VSKQVYYQGILSEVEGYVRLTSLLGQLVLYEREKHIFSVLKAADVG